MSQPKIVKVSSLSWKITIELTRDQAKGLAAFHDYSGNIRSALKGFKTVEPFIDSGLTALRLYSEVMKKDEEFRRSLMELLPNL